MSYGNFILIFVLGSLLVLNVILVIRDRENSNSIHKLKSAQSDIQNELGSHRKRLRRDVTADKDAVALVIKNEINRSILEKVSALLPEALKSIPPGTWCKCDTKNLTENANNETGNSYAQPMNNENDGKKCKNGIKGEKGDPGPRGPKGDRGEKGFSLIEPQLKQTDLDKTVLISENKTLKCKFFGNPIPSIDWVLKGNNYEIKNVVFKSSSEVISYLTVSNVSFENHGNVSCRGKSILGQVEKTGFLNVHIKPSVSLISTIIYVYLASNATFPKCNVVSNPASKIIWKKGFGQLPTARSIQSGFGDFTIVDVLVEDEGFYVCSAENYLGSDTGVVQLKTKPLKIAYGPPAELVVFSYPHTLWCGAFGRTNQMSGSWRSLAAGRTLYFSESKNTSFYNISLQVTESGIYSCEFTDGISTTERVSVIRNFTLQSNMITNTTATKKIYDFLKKVNVPTNECIRCMQISHMIYYNSNSLWNYFQPCYSKSNTLLIVRLMGYESYIFGGFAETPWSNVQYSSSNKTFVFATYPDNMLKIIDLGNTQLCSKYSRYGRIFPCFGFEQFTFEETAYDDSVKVKSPLLLGSTTPVAIRDMEVFYFN
ncbi:uncharacterized protein LOC100203629 [Hydra vulgaris]|uniref:uncharacterized protein LOC100203629 n=1 Tax=Hydra vulgaris TaxID=6087 RepID=UPI001F5E637C|nr:uncharacterized protein LOC100203629 [Hydra vulgaris]